MSRVDDIIAAESDELERAELPDPLPKTVRVDYRNEARSKMFSLRLRDEELARLVEVAGQLGLPPRTLARAWLLDRLKDEPDHRAEGLTARVERLERAVFDS
jgi:hypothetical protein